MCYLLLRGWKPRKERYGGLLLMRLTHVGWTYKATSVTGLTLGVCCLIYVAWMLYTGVIKYVETPAAWYDYDARFVGALLPSIFGLIYIHLLKCYAFLWSRTEINGEILTQTLCGKCTVIDMSEPVEVSYVSLMKQADHLRRWPSPFSPRYERAIGRLSWVAQISLRGRVVRLYPPAIRPAPADGELPAVLSDIFAAYKAQGYMIS